MRQMLIASLVLALAARASSAQAGYRNLLEETSTITGSFTTWRCTTRL